MDQPVQITNELQTPQQIPFWKRKPVLIGLGLFITVAIAVTTYFWTNRKVEENSSITPLTLDNASGLDERYSNITKTNGNTGSTFTVKGMLSNILAVDEELTRFTLDLGRKVAREDYNNFTVFVHPSVKPPMNEALPQEVELTITCKDETHPCELIKLDSLQAKLPTDSIYISIAEKLDGWLNSQYDPKTNVYTSGTICQINGSCQTSSTALSEGLSFIWGKYHYYKALNNTNDKNAPSKLKELERDLNNYNKFVTADSGIQFQFFSCTYLYDLWSDTTLSLDTRNTAAELCGLHYDIENQPDDNNLDYINTMQTSVNSKNSITPLSTSRNGLALEKAAARVSHYAIRSIFKKERDLNPTQHKVEGAIENDSLERASNWFAEALKLYNEENTLFPESTCELGTAATEMYRATNDQRYLSFAEQFTKKIDIPTECTSNSSQSQCSKSQYEATTCIDFLYRLYKTTKKELYLSGSKDIMNHLSNTYFDSNNYSGRITNDGSFYQILSSSSPDQGRIIKSLKINGLLLGLLGQMEIQ